MLVTNARSIFPKIDELQLFVSTFHVDMTIITESWLHNKIDDDVLTLHNCQIFRCDRTSRRGGGVCIWINTSFDPILLTPVSPMPISIELIFVRLSCNAFHLLCCGVYIPPGLSRADHNSVTDYLVSELDHLFSLYPHDKLLIAGDFNDFNTDFFQESFGLVNRVTEATRRNALLDHIWIDESVCDFYPSPASVGPPLKNSDHNCILLRPLRQLQSVKDYRPHLVWDLRDANICDYFSRLSSSNFDAISSENSVDDMCENFYCLFDWCLSAIPCEIVFFSSTDKPWMTPVLKLLINKRWTAFRERNWPLYKHYKAKVTTEIKKAKRIWYEKQSKTPRGLWNVVKMQQGSCLKNPWQRLLKENGDLPTLLRNLTAELCKNFNTDSDVELQPLADKEWNFYISHESVFHLLSRLKSRKAAGPDLIPPVLLKIGAKFLCKPLANIFNVSISTKTFPTLLKRAHVCPVPKKSSPGLCDFRPISLLSPIAKIFERLVLNHVKFEMFSCFGPEQHSYRPLGSTTTALVELCEHVTRALDCRQTTSVDVFCLDLSKAFDKLQHHRLLNFLSENGFCHGFLCWLHSYLSSRTMNVKVLNSLGPSVVIPSGVPQGSVLGPFLFAAFMGSVRFPFANVQCVKYADDVSLIEPLSRYQTPSVTLDVCVSVFAEKGLIVNRSKCKQIRFCRSRVHASHHDSGFTRVDSLKILGITFSNTLKWDCHVSAMLSTASQRLYIIRRLKDCMNSVELARVYHAMISSVFFYASPVYGRLPSKLSTKLERFQRRAHRLICDQTCDCVLFPSVLSKLQDAAVKILLLSEVNPEHPLHAFVPHRLPASNRLSVPFCVTNRRQNSFFPWSTELYNSRFFC